MNVFVIGATGYIGGSVAARLVEAGHRVIGQARTEEKAAQLRERGIEAVVATLDDTEVLAETSRSVDAVINAADSDNAGVVTAIVGALSGTGKTFIQTSGSSIVSDLAAGKASDNVYDEDTLPEPVADKAERVGIDRAVLTAAEQGVRSIVICPTMVYGRGRGINPKSIQVPMLVQQARNSGIARYIGEGENIWSNVHIADLEELYLLAMEKAPAGTFFFAENGEASLKSVAEAIRSALELAHYAQSWPIEDAIQEWGYGAAMYGLASNSRVRAKNAREILGWKPERETIFESIINEYGVGYRE